ncbi:hypothetical protein B0H14DRAFT_2585540 [Mycena olivaceomarginata]|nr:hypothetical protein B0H14DRAFT_2585540 [Mycena olivaceomarginata]
MTSSQMPWALTWSSGVLRHGLDLFIKLSNVLIGLRRRTLEVRFSGTRSYRSTEPLAAPLGRRLIPTTKPWKLQLCLLRSRLIVKYINIDICEPPMLNWSLQYLWTPERSYTTSKAVQIQDISPGHMRLGPLWILQIKASEATVVEISRSHASLYTTWYYSMCDVEVLVNPSGVRGTGSVI